MRIPTPGDPTDGTQPREAEMRTGPGRAVNSTRSGRLARGCRHRGRSARPAPGPHQAWGLELHPPPPPPAVEPQPRSEALTPTPGLPFPDAATATWSAIASPHWRWVRATALAADPGTGADRTDDAITRAAVAFLTARAANDADRLHDTPLAAAVAIFEADDQDRWLLEAMVLTRTPAAAVARKVGLDPAIAMIFELLFFDVRDKLRCPGWITAHCLGPPPHLGYEPDDLGPIWRRAAYRGGEAALNIVRAVTTGHGRENYSADVSEAAEIYVAVDRLGVAQSPARLLQVALRLRATAAGVPLHPADYHLPRRRGRTPGSVGAAGEPSGDAAGPAVGEAGFGVENLAASW